MKTFAVLDSGVGGAALSQASWGVEGGAAQIFLTAPCREKVTVDRQTWPPGQTWPQGKFLAF